MTRWIAAERARAALRCAETCPNVTGRTKERVAQSTRARTDLLALLTSHNGTNSYPLEGGISATIQHVSDVACSCFFGGGVGVCFLMFCRSLVVSLNSLNQARFPHMFSSTMCLVFCFSPFFASFLFYFFAFSEYIYTEYMIWVLLLVVFLLDLSFF